MASIGFLDSLNNSKYLFAMMMLLMNVGGKYIEMDISKHHKSFLATSVIFRRLLIFTIAFIATRDVVSSLIITASFVILVLHLFNYDSEYCILSKPDYSEYDLDKNGTISPEEIKEAYLKLKKAGKIK